MKSRRQRWMDLLNAALDQPAPSKAMRLAIGALTRDNSVRRRLRLPPLTDVEQFIESLNVIDLEDEQ